MPKGGAREGAGRPSPWKSSSKTKILRVPEELADEVLVYAKKLDRQRTSENQLKKLLAQVQQKMGFQPGFIQMSEEVVEKSSEEDRQGTLMLMELLQRVANGKPVERPILNLDAQQIYLLDNEYVVRLVDLLSDYQVLVDPAKVRKREKETDEDILRQFPRQSLSIDFLDLTRSDEPSNIPKKYRGSS